MKSKRLMTQLLMCAGLVGLLVGGVAQTNAATPEAEVRATVQQVFDQLKNKDFDALYDSLPSSSRSRVQKERFTSALRRSQDIYSLDRIEIGRTRVLGSFAVVDTTLYGRVLKPFDTEGKIVAQQYLVKEDQKWRVATGDNDTIRKFLQSNPGFGRNFVIRQPRVFIKKDSSWVEFSPRRPQPK